MIVIEVGYRKYVLPKEKAMMLAECLETAEMYEESTGARPSVWKKA